jgi:sulfite reductase alpha subunit-like flavoprotein
VINFEDFNKETFGQEPDTVTIVCVATHYEGEPCDNAAGFVEWLKELKKSKQRLFFKFEVYYFWSWRYRL